MKIELYPEYEEIFENDDLKGIFYPLCKVSDFSSPINAPLFFVSHIGVWTDNNIKNAHNQSNFICFEIKNGKYHFRGDLNVYPGHQQAKKVFETLETDFEQNGNNYLSKKIKSDLYIENITKNYILDFGELDSEYFLKTFYEFSINKLNYSKTGNFGTFNEVINDWGKADKSPIVYDIKDDNSTGFADILLNKEYLFPETIKIDNYEKIGFVAGNEFFTEGNNTYMVYDHQNNRVICINHYS